jgi:plastin-1
MEDESEGFGAVLLQVYHSLQVRVTANEGANEGGGGGGKASPSFLKSNTTTLQYNPDEAEKLCYVVHINTYLGKDPFLKNYLQIDPTGNQLFDLVRDGVLLW